MYKQFFSLILAAFICSSSQIYTEADTCQRKSYTQKQHLVRMTGRVIQLIVGLVALKIFSSANLDKALKSVFTKYKQENTIELMQGTRAICIIATCGIFGAYNIIKGLYGIKNIIQDMADLTESQ